MAIARYRFNILDSRAEICVTEVCVTEELRSVITFGLTIMVIPHTKKNVSYRMYCELMESFGVVLYDVH